MSHAGGRWLSLSLPRRFMADLVHFAQQVPCRSMQREMALGAVVAAREDAWPRPGWCAVFLKAFALVAARRDHLRQVYVPLPWAHLYEHSINVASVAVSRHFGDEDAVFFASLAQPEEMSLLDIDRRLRAFKEQPIADVRDFRHLLRLASLPLPLRRLLMGLVFYASGKLAAQWMGTFGVNSMAGMGASEPELLSPWSTAVHYDVFRPDGKVYVRLSYDHRVRDAAIVARVLADLEDVLRGEIVNELRYLRAAEAA